ncbi:MAG: DUF4835 family protein [Bacteroidales bacterium]|nr:DUF4835 family protein [Bacteroidales bacterium]
MLRCLREPGWKPYDGSRNRNRYWLVKNILDNEYSGAREFTYLYHRRGLDNMELTWRWPEVRSTRVCAGLQEVYRSRPDPFMIT